MKRGLVAIALLAAASAHADPWYRGRAGTHRVVHGAVTAASGLVYVASETFLKSDLASSTCRWCAPPAFDASVRGALLWQHPSTAGTISNFTSWVGPPVALLGLTLAGAATASDSSWGRAIDDALPVVEAAATSAVFTQLVKFAVARQRPFVHFATPPVAPDLDDNVSFFSGHTTFAFALAAGAGAIAHRRHSWTEPYIWAAGGTLALTTAYLRIAADQHYLSDVLAGALVGSAFGLAIPALFDRADVTLLPSPTGVALAMRW